MKVNSVPIQSYGPTQGITGTGSDVCLCAPHFPPIPINKHNKNKGGGNTRAGSIQCVCIYIWCKKHNTAALLCTEQLIIRIWSPVHCTKWSSKKIKLSGPRKTDTKPQALYLCSPTVNCDAQSSMSLCRPPVKQVHLLSDSVSLIPAEEEEEEGALNNKNKFKKNNTFLADYCSHYFNPVDRVHFWVITAC